MKFWRGHSTDPNLMENIWAHIKAKLGGSDELWEAVGDEWSRTDSAHCKRPNGCFLKETKESSKTPKHTLHTDDATLLANVVANLN